MGPQKNNLDNMFMHLTNYAIQKQSDAFVHNEGAADDSGHKRSLTSVLEYMKEHEPGFDAERMMERINDIAVKTAISAQPALSHAFKAAQPDDLENSMSFQILGLDIMID